MSAAEKLDDMEAPSSIPSLTEFNPARIPYQLKVIRDVRKNYDYKLGTHEVMLSGSVGSAKSLLMAHIGITHCTLFDGARFCLGRLTMPDLKDTLLSMVLEHMEGDLVEGEDYQHNKTTGAIDFSNGSEIICKSWHDKKFKKFRSYPLSGAAIEELTENGEDYKKFYPELKMRVGRLPHVPEKFIISATNPDAPSHWAYQYFIQPPKPSPTRHVYYSRTEDNPFLPPEYIQQLRTDLDPKMARRMLDGEWLEIGTEVIYHQYARERNYRASKYVPDPKYPIRISFDFNIGLGKPMSACAFQYLRDQDEAHFFEDFVVQGARTEDLCEEMAGRGLFEHATEFIIHGDRNGKNNDTRSTRTDYDIIESYLANFRTDRGAPIRFTMAVRNSNPPLRKRHNLMNAYCHNSLGRVRLWVYEAAPTLDRGMSLTKLKNGGNYIEDDSFDYQHVTTAAGYGLIYATEETTQRSTTRVR